MSVIFFTIVIFALFGVLTLGKVTFTSKHLYLAFCFGCMILLHTFVNPDYSDNFSYRFGYNEIGHMDFVKVLHTNPPSLKAEVGYRLFNKILYYFSNEWLFGLFAISVLMLSGYYLVVKKYSNFYAISVLLIMIGPFMQSTFVLRQHLAMGIILFTYPFIIERKVIPYLLICFIAILFHQTAAIFIPVYFLYHLSGSKFTVVSVVCFLSLYFYMSFFLASAGEIAMETAGYGSSYFEIDEEKGTNLKTAFLLSFLFVIRLFILKKKFFEEGISRLLSILLTLGLIFSIAGTGFIGTNRMIMYFTSVQFLIIPNTFCYLKDRKLSYAGCYSYFFVLLYFFIKNADNFDGIWFFSPEFK